MSNIHRSKTNRTDKHRIEYFELLDRWISQYPDKKVVIDGQGDMTYAQMDEESARVYAWLKAHGIGREDFVMIHLPRTAKVLSAMEGIFKAGAAYVITPLDFPPERFDYVYKDCGCRLNLTQDIYDDMMKCEPLAGREEADLHDALYAVYTSGTQGNPKGVLHEYGNLDQTWKSAYCNGEPFVTFNDIYGLIAPHNFAVMNIVTVHALAQGGTIYFAPTEIVKNPNLLRDAFEKAGVTVTYLPPSFLQVLNGFNSQIRKLMLSSELSRGVYYDGITVINAHAMSECCFETSTFLIDKPYDRPPIGEPAFDNKHWVINGEYCFENKYFRGYINKPEMTARCWDGDIFHSGDMADVLEDGNIVLTGRKDFMLKISGNRVEPAEVEGLLSRGLGLKHVIVKGYKEARRSYLCAYYTDDVIIDPKEAREKLIPIAPKYMIPEYYVRMDEFPLIANGKMDYQALKKPDVNDYRKPYAAPVTEEEKRVVAAFEAVLELEHIGIDDDFFELGGDSLRAIEMVIKVNQEGFSSLQIYDLRTPRAIAGRMSSVGDCIDGPERISAKSCMINPEEGTEEAAAAGQMGVPAEVYSQYMLDYQAENPESTLFTVLRLFRIREKRDIEGNLTQEMKNLNEQRIIETFDKTCNAHPQLQSVFVKKDGVWTIVSAPEKMQKLVVEEMSEAEFESIRNDLEKPFVPGECVYNFRLIRTEKNLYFVNAFHHSAIDGNGIKAFRKDFGRIYAGGEPIRDHYLKCRAELEAQKKTDKYAADKAYLEKKFDSDRWSGIPNPDHTENGLYGFITCELPDGADTGNSESLAAILNAMAQYNNTRDVIATWTYHNRDTKEKQECVGLFIRDIPVGITIGETDTREDILRKVEEEIEDGIRHMSYQWALYSNQEIIYTVTQEGLRDYNGFDGLDGEFVEVPEHSRDIVADNPMDVEFFNRDRGKGFILRYDMGMYDAASAERFADLVRKWYE